MARTILSNRATRRAARARAEIEAALCQGSRDYSAKAKSVQLLRAAEMQRVNNATVTQQNMIIADRANLDSHRDTVLRLRLPLHTSRRQAYQGLSNCDLLLRRHCSADEVVQIERVTILESQNGQHRLRRLGT